MQPRSLATTGLRERPLGLSNEPRQAPPAERRGLGGVEGLFVIWLRGVRGWRLNQAENEAGGGRSGASLPAFPRKILSKALTLSVQRNSTESAGRGQTR